MISGLSPPKFSSFSNQRLHTKRCWLPQWAPHLHRGLWHIWKLLEHHLLLHLDDSMSWPKKMTTPRFPAALRLHVYASGCFWFWVFKSLLPTTKFRKMLLTFSRQVLNTGLLLIPVHGIKSPQLSETNCSPSWPCCRADSKRVWLLRMLPGA